MKALKLVVLAMVLVGVFVVPALGQEAAPANAYKWAVGIGAGLGAALTMIGAAYGISTIAKASVESMARQPEVAGQINGAMIVSAALIEGATFFALIVCLLVIVLT